MKKGKNITLLIGSICIAVQFLLSILGLIHKVSYYGSGEGLTRLSFYVISFSICDVFFSVIIICFPLILLFQNLKNNSGKILPIISIIINCIVLCRIVFSVIANAPSYIIHTELGLINTYLDIFLRNSLFLVVVGLFLLIIGSALSLSKKKEKTRINDEITSS